MHATPPAEHPAKEVAAEAVKEVPAEHPPAEKPVEKPSEAPHIEKPAEIPQPAEAPLIDLGQSPRKRMVPENHQWRRCLKPTNGTSHWQSTCGGEA
ncbi:hypothetical protein ANCDUO_18259 [Ancylostoma duodenale]|uniref:Uncharacterized protein n=1 Tax=Ancylostoma duodenale TaxID=51022 RepID=A0A0C2CPE1_9BILA|nr:hypothetical protein ANCDUO_18259 [Ancylostoma duodenale]